MSGISGTNNLQIWTVGHSTRKIEDFIDILKTHNIEVLADIRSYPGSKRYPQFNKNSLDVTLAKSGIEYIHILELGGRRRPSRNSKHGEWNNAAFRAYADYMETDSFLKGISLLTSILSAKRTAMMCAEALWWRCHRRMVSDYLTARGITVVHIFDKNKTDVHVLRTPGETDQKELFA